MLRWLNVQKLNKGCGGESVNWRILVEAVYEFLRALAFEAVEYVTSGLG